MIFRDKCLLVIAHTYHSFVKDQVELLAPHFAQVTVLVRYKPIAEIATLFPIDAFQRHMKAAALDLHNLPGNVRVIPVPLLYLPMDRWYKRLGEQHYRAVEKVIEKEKLQFDLIHAHFAWSAGYVGMKLKERYQKPLVVTGHGYDVYDLPFRDQEWRFLLKGVYDSADYIITVSKNNLTHLQELNVHVPVTVIQNGYREELFHPRDLNRCRRALNLPLTKRIILTVGNLTEVKGQRHLLEAMHHIVEKYDDVLCLIIGEGQLRNRLKKQVAHLNLENVVQLVGSKPHHEIPLWINAADRFVLPSLKEGNPTVMFECLACGIPFIGTQVGGMPEIIKSVSYGVLVRPADSGELAQAIASSLDQTFDRHVIAAYAEQFNYKSITEQVLQIYGQVGSGSGSRANR